ncbi:hypothetical protein GDO86_019496 [Hymenochirus boettgeri]|nr:hypothetical protein GDO86_019496 [Hymenochirus boettgeri]
MGDLNAGCAHVPMESWKDIRLRTNREFVWLIGDNVDTMVRRNTSCPYDRIVVIGDKLIRSIVPGSAGKYDFMEAYGLTEDQALEVSDHFPVEMELMESTREVDQNEKERLEMSEQTEGNH